MCDGDYYFNRKGEEPIRPQKPQTLIITGNRNPESIYGERTEHGKTYESRIPLFNARFRTVNIPG